MGENVTVETDSLNDLRNPKATSMKPTCSRCGSPHELHLVTLRTAGLSAPGRLLVYCPRCRDEYSPHIGVDVPIEDVTVETFVGLYRDGTTESAPETAARIAFGRPAPEAVEGAVRALEARRAEGQARRSPR